MFFSTATRPTVRKTGRGRSRLAPSRGRNSPASTPRVQSLTLRKRRCVSSCAIVGVAAMTAVAGAWKRRSHAQVRSDDHRLASGMRSAM